MKKKTFHDYMLANTRYLIRARKKYKRKFDLPLEIVKFEKENRIPKSKRIRRSFKGKL